MTINYQRRSVLKNFCRLATGSVLVSLPMPAFAAIEGVMYKNPTCSCCETYAAYLEKNGFKIDIKPTNDLAQVSTSLGVPAKLQGCHTITVGDYIFVGFVPIEHIRKMTMEMPKIRGLAMPGMPMGIPNMGFPLMAGMEQETYTTYAFTTDGKEPFAYGTYPPK